MFGSFLFFLSSQLSARRSTLKQRGLSARSAHGLWYWSATPRTKNAMHHDELSAHCPKHATPQTSAVPEGNKPVGDRTLSHCIGREKISANGTRAAPGCVRISS